MSNRWIAFLRAINVGGHTVKMDRLRGLFGELGFTQVETFIASGNVIFDAAEADAQLLERKIEAHLKQSLGYEVATFLRSPAELKAIAEYAPFSSAELGAEGATLFIGMLPAAPDEAAAQRLLALNNAIDSFQIYGRELYWLRRSQLSILAGAQLERALKLAATLRNSTTMRKMAAKYG